MIEKMEKGEFGAQLPLQGEGGLDFFAVLWRRKATWICILGITLALAYLYALKATPVYESGAQLLLIKKEAPSAGMEAQLGYEDTVSTQILLITSPEVVQDAIEQGQLGALASLKGEENPLATVIENLEAEQAGGRGVVDPNVMQISYRGLNPDDCAAVLQAVIESYQEFLGGTYDEFSKETVGLITEAKDDLHEQLTNLEAEYRDHRQKAPLLWRGDEGANLHEARMAEIEAARSQVLVENAQIQARIDAIENALATGSRRAALMLLIENQDPDKPGKSGYGNRGVFEAKLFEVLLEEQALLESYGHDHPKVKAVRNKMDLIRQYLGSLPQEHEGPVDLLDIYIESLHEELAIGKKRLAEYDRLFEDENSDAKNLAHFQLNDEFYRNEIARTKQLFDGVLKQLGEMNLAKDYSGLSTALISRPARGQQVWPNLVVVLVIAAGVGLIAGFGLALLVEVADKRFRSPEDIQGHFGLPVVGHIPVIAAAKQRRRVKKAAAEPSPLLCTMHQPKGREAETYRAVRTSLYFSARAEGHRVVQVTSPSPGDGKTTLAANLAVSIANSGRKVLLLDADFRRPRVHRYFALGSDVGASSIIAGEAELPEAIRQGPVENLWVITSGPKLQHPADLLTSSRFKELIDVLREQYEFVIVDSPPLLAVTDPASIAPRVDAVLMVIRLTKNARHATRHALDILNALEAKVMGIVVNGIGKGNVYGRYGYNSYRYGYRYSSYRYGGYEYGYGPTNGNGRDDYYGDEEAGGKRPEERPAGAPAKPHP